MLTGRNFAAAFAIDLNKPQKSFSDRSKIASRNNVTHIIFTKLVPIQLKQKIGGFRLIGLRLLIHQRSKHVVSRRQITKTVCR